MKSIFSGFIPGMSASLMADAQQRAAAFTQVSGN